jgi:hypothetical protein
MGDAVHKFVRLAPVSAPAPKSCDVRLIGLQPLLQGEPSVIGCGVCGIQIVWIRKRHN